MYGLFTALSVHLVLPGFLIVTAIFAYIFTTLIGIPAFMFYKAWNYKSLLSFIIGGLIIGIPPAVFFTFVAGVNEFLVTPLAGAVASSAFWYIAIKGSDDTLRSPHSELG